jgi:hypothetical protein
MKNRTFNKMYARLNGYFWLPCPLCGQHFGGHEWSHGNKCSSIPKPGSPGTGMGICPDCTEAGKGYYDEAYFGAL